MISEKKQQELLAIMAKLEVKEGDLDESFVRGQGRGGQKKQKSSNAVVLKHLPTGIVVRSEKSRSQADNRFFARRMLCEKLLVEIHGEKTQRQTDAIKKAKQKKRRKRRTQN